MIYQLLETFVTSYRCSLRHERTASSRVECTTLSEDFRGKCSCWLLANYLLLLLTIEINKISEYTCAVCIIAQSFYSTQIDGPIIYSTLLHYFRL